MRWLMAVPLALGTVWASAVAAEPVTLEGRVAWREQLMLPAGAVTHVALLGASDAGGVPVAETTLEGMRAPPIPFELTYDSADLDPGNEYALSARITLGEQVLFETAKPQPLLEPARSQTVMLVVRLAER